MNEAIAEEQGGAPLWLISFADLTAILVALFILLYSMSSTFSGTGSGVAAAGDAPTDIANAAGPTARLARGDLALANLRIGYLSAVLAERDLAPVATTGPVSQSVETDRLVVRLAPAFAFEPGSRTLRPMAGQVVADVTDILKHAANPVSVLVPVQGNDWSVAFDRAESAVRQLRRAGYEAPIERFVTPGLSDSGLLIVVSRSGRLRS